MNEEIITKSSSEGGWLYETISENGEANFTCENCKFPHVKYVHRLRHQKTGQIVNVGKVCAEHLTQDFTSPGLRERSFKHHAARRMRWPTLNWKFSHQGNLRLKNSGNIVVLKKGPYGGWAASYLLKDREDWIRVPGWHDIAEAAKLAAFDALYPR